MVVDLVVGVASGEREEASLESDDERTNESTQQREWPASRLVKHKEKARDRVSHGTKVQDIGTLEGGSEPRGELDRR
jgi:hypothetical protein